MSSVQPAFDNSYVKLPERFYEKRGPLPVAAPEAIKINRDLALELGLDPDWLAGPEGLAMLAGNAMPDAAEPIAQAYAGHQFGQFVPQLGDGRALLLGELVDARGTRRDIQLKGSGRTAFSRGGDGRAAIGPILREYVVSEAMAALGIPTTRALAAVKTGEPVYREEALPGAILTRVAASHIRVGTFQYFAARGDSEGLRLLADHAIARHYPDVRQAENPPLALLEAVMEAQCGLVAQWMLVGFIHGVMNTDNMTISGETIDYGPCAFMDRFDPSAVFSSIDQGGRYAYGNQPQIAHWNLTRFAETLLPLIDEDEDKAVEMAKDVLRRFPQRFEETFNAGWFAKLGLAGEGERDVSLVRDLLKTMAQGGADFTLTFRALAQDAGSEEGALTARVLFADPAPFDEWADKWQQRLSETVRNKEQLRGQLMAINPRYIPRNHRVEAVISAAVSSDDFRPFEELLRVLSKPFDEQPEHEHYALPPEPGEEVTQTFCGT